MRQRWARKDCKMEDRQMRVMRVMAGNVSYNVRDMSKTKKYIWPEDYPPSPASPAHGSSLAISLAGNSHRDVSLGCGFKNSVNSKGDVMTIPINPDSAAPKTGVLPFEPGALDRSGLRLTRAEFARFLGVSKQTVGEWVTAGKISLGADGRLDPRQAVSQLLRNSDPARLRAKVLEPLARDIGSLQRRVSELERALAAATEDAEFHEECAGELATQLNAFDNHLRNERDVLVTLPADKVIDSIHQWWTRVSEDGTAAAGLLSILECVPDNGLDILQHELVSLNEPDNFHSGAPGIPEEGGGNE